MIIYLASKKDEADLNKESEDPEELFPVVRL